jgi:hypothetical protein
VTTAPSVSERTIALPFNKVWSGLIGSVGKTFFSIDNLSQQVGVDGPVGDHEDRFDGAHRIGFVGRPVVRGGLVCRVRARHHPS